MLQDGTIKIQLYFQSRRRNSYQNDFFYLIFNAPLEFEHQHTIERHTYTHLLNFTRPKEQQFLRLLLAVNSWAFSLTFSFKRNMSAKFKYDYPIFLRLYVTEKKYFYRLYKAASKMCKTTTFNFIFF